MSDPANSSRRSFLLGASAAVAIRAVPTVSYAAGVGALADLSAVDAAAGMARGDFSAEQYARALLARCAATQSLNAFITLEPDKVLEAARDCDRKRRAGTHKGPLFGLPLPIKDSVGTRDYPTTAGTPALRNFRPAKDASIVQVLRVAGAIVLGKTNLHELSFGWTSNNAAFGPVHNEVLYCRREQLTGARFQTKVCKTAVRILEDQRRAKDFTNSAQQKASQ
jgi:mandelamide amidase